MRGRRKEQRRPVQNEHPKLRIINGGDKRENAAWPPPRHHPPHPSGKGSASQLPPAGTRSTGGSRQLHAATSPARAALGPGTLHTVNPDNKDAR